MESENWSLWFTSMTTRSDKTVEGPDNGDRRAAGGTAPGVPHVRRAGPAGWADVCLEALTKALRTEVRG